MGNLNQEQGVECNQVLLGLLNSRGRFDLLVDGIVVVGGWHGNFLRVLVVLVDDGVLSRVLLFLTTLDGTYGDDSEDKEHAEKDTNATA